MRFRGLEKSSYFQVLREQAQIQEARKLLLQLGRIRFGPPGRKISQEIKSIDNLKRLRRLSERLLRASSWAELLDESS
jgi:hypothetical protein